MSLLKTEICNGIRTWEARGNLSCCHSGSCAVVYATISQNVLRSSKHKDIKV